MKLPRLAKKLRVMTDWTLDLFFGKEIEQIVTLRDIKALTDQIARIRARGGRPTPQSSLLQTMPLTTVSHKGDTTL